MLTSFGGTGGAVVAAGRECRMGLLVGSDAGDGIEGGVQRCAGTFAAWLPQPKISARALRVFVFGLLLSLGAAGAMGPVAVLAVGALRFGEEKIDLDVLCAAVVG
jgi:hypothetical protein